MSDIKCSFFGHRKIEITEELKQRIELTVEELILKHNVSVFLLLKGKETERLTK